jgi:hypothetical protein
MPTIDELREQVAAIETARREKLQAQADKVEGKMLEEKIKLADLETKEGILGRDIAAVFSPKSGEMVVVRTPAPVVFQRFQEKVLSPKAVSTADLYELIYACLVYPDKKSFQAICDAAPGMLSSAMNALQSLNGAANEDTAGK